MKTVCKIIIVALGLFLISTSASATDYRHHSGGLSISIGSHGNHIRFGYNNSHYDNYKYGHHYRHGYSHKPRYTYKYWHRPRYGYNSYRYNYFDYRQPNYLHNKYKKHRTNKTCQPVTKVIVDRYGKYHGVAGTMCYDQYGQAYIKSDSRYLKR